MNRVFDILADLGEVLIFIVGAAALIISACVVL